ncbi:MAG: response regulator [Verrucomicrobia bacterium]|nr:response regulator [Verrucomicrobiota bacterium]
MRKHLAAGQTWEGKSTNHRKDGTVYNEELMASPVRNEAGRVAHHVLLIRDVTEKNELEQQLLQSQKMEALGQMAGGVAHDFNNLLTAILGYCSAAMDRVADDSSTYEDLKQVVLAGERAARMTRKLLALGRKNMAVSEPADLNGLITDMEPFLRRTLTSDVELEIDLGASDQMVLLDKSSLEQVILNLVVNARDAMTSGGHLQVKTDRIVIKEENRNGFADVTPGSYMLLSVRDDGCGMTEKIQTRIFEPFFTTKEKDKGTGLGLSTVYSIIRQGGGFVSAKSDIGVGTTFELLLPLADGEDNGLKIRESVQETRGTETILLTEDEVAVRALCARTLTSRGYHVLQASNGAEALSMYQASEGKINMVITDMTMPTMGGKDLVEQLRRIKPDLHVLFMTGFTEDVACNHATGRKYPMLLKPFTQQALVERVRGILGRDAETYEESAPARRPAE